MNQKQLEILKQVLSNQEYLMRNLKALPNNAPQMKQLEIQQNIDKTNESIKEIDSMLEDEAAKKLAG